MVKVKITNAFGQGYTQGQIVEVDAAEAKRLIDLNACEIIGPPAQPKKETADAAGPGKAEKAVTN